MSLICSHCKAPIHVPGIDLMPSRHPKRYYYCERCGGDNLLTRKTILIYITPSLLFLLLFFIFWPFDPDSHWMLPAGLASYAAGMPFGVWLARRYGGFVATVLPELRPRQRDD